MLNKNKKLQRCRSARSLSSRLKIMKWHIGQKSKLWNSKLSTSKLQFFFSSKQSGFKKSHKSREINLGQECQVDLSFIKNHNSSCIIGAKGSQAAGVSKMNKYSHRLGSDVPTNLFSAPHLKSTVADLDGPFQHWTPRSWLFSGLSLYLTPTLFLDIAVTFVLLFTML